MKNQNIHKLQKKIKNSTRKEEFWRRETKEKNEKKKKLKEEKRSNNLQNCHEGLSYDFGR